MEARGKSVSNAGVIGFLTLCVIMASCLFTPAMGEETDSASILTDLAVVKNVTFTRKGKSDVVAVFLDRPFIYSYYPLSDPPRGVIDLAQSDPGAYLEPISYQGGQVKQLRFIKEDLGSGQLTRLEFLLQDNADFIVRSSPEDNLKLVITFSGGGKSSMTAASTSPVPVLQPPKRKLVLNVPVTPSKVSESVAVAESKSTPPVVSRNSAPVQPKSSPMPEVVSGRAASHHVMGPTLRKIVVIPEGIDLLIDAPVRSSSTFFMKKPNRMVIDLPGVLIALPIDKLPIKAFGIDSVRLGRHEGKSRVVFEGASDAVLRAKLITTDTGLRLLPASAPSGTTP